MKFDNVNNCLKEITFGEICWLNWSSTILLLNKISSTEVFDKEKFIKTVTNFDWDDPDEETVSLIVNPIKKKMTKIFPNTNFDYIDSGYIKNILLEL